MRATICLVLVTFSSALQGQQQSRALRPPFGVQNRLVSPNGAYALVGDQQRNELLLEDERTSERRHVLTATIQTLTLAWSPDSAAFLVNDRMMSDVEYAYIYDVRTLDKLDLRGHVVASVLAHEPGAARFLPGVNAAANHSYFHGLRWLDAGHVELRLFGHTDGTRNPTPVPDDQDSYVIPGACFDLRYRISRDGVVEKLSQRTVSLTSPECSSIE
jgi:hypothetical protein